jgi:predicted nucleotidyltransferase
MDISSVKFEKFTTIKVRDMLKAFVDAPMTDKIVDGKFTPVPKCLSLEFIVSTMRTTSECGVGLFKELVEQGFIDGYRCAPTPKGMALVAAKRRPRITLARAKALVKALVKEAKEINARPRARVLIEELHVFGSYLKEKASLGDVDVWVIVPLPKEAEPEDLDEQLAVMRRLEVSRYVSLHWEFDAIARQANKRLIYRRRKK